MIDFFKRIGRWFLAQRSSTRLGFMLEIACRIGFSLFSFLWTPLLLGSMGKSLNGLFVTFQKMTTLGGLGDLGMGGLVNIQTSRMLGQRKEKELSAFLADVRGIFLLLSLVISVGFLAASPFLFRVFHFDTNPDVGWLTPLAFEGAMAIAVVILRGYIGNLNYGCGNVAGPAVPSFVLLQLGFFGHWLLARQHAPLWVQYFPYLASAVATGAMLWLFVRYSHRPLAAVRPLHLNRRRFLELAGKSFWLYVSALGNGIYVTTDLLIITAGFGSEIVPSYANNNRLCELVLFVVAGASLASMPKITQWLASPETETRERGIRELLRLNRFQTFLGCCGMLVYLQLNDWFVRLWLGPDFNVPLSWQAAFAANVGATAAGLMGSDLSSRCSEKGIRVSGMAVFLSGLLNLSLSFVSMKLGSIPGIAVATVIAQSLLTVSLGWYSARQLNLSWWRLSVKPWLVAAATLVFGVAARMLISSELTAGLVALRTLLHLAAFLALAWMIGITWKDVQHEVDIFRRMFGGQKTAA